MTTCQSRHELSRIGSGPCPQPYQNGYGFAIPNREFPKLGTPPTLPGMDAKTARTLNIRKWVAAEGGPALFSQKLDGRWAATQVSQWISESKPKPIGHALARALEEAGGRRPGSLDHVQDEGKVKGSEIAEPSSHYLTLDAAILADAYLLAYQEAGVELGIEYRLEKDPQRTVKAYEFLVSGERGAGDIASYMAAAMKRRQASESGGEDGRRKRGKTVNGR